MDDEVKPQENQSLNMTLNNNNKYISRVIKKIKRALWENINQEVACAMRRKIP